LRKRAMPGPSCSATRCPFPLRKTGSVFDHAKTTEKYRQLLCLWDVDDRSPANHELHWRCFL
jgi:hypothetical protein